MKKSDPYPDRSILEDLPSAGGQLKERWSDRVAWSLMAAVVLHFAVFALSPDWAFFERPRADRRGAAAQEALSATRLLSVSRAGGGVGAIPQPENTDSVRETSRSEGSASGPGAAGAEGRDNSYSDNLRERLESAGRPALALTEPPAPSSSRPDSGHEQVQRDSSLTVLEGRAATVGIADTRRDSAPMLRRLRSLGPEIVTGLGSSEALIRNPREVAEFKEFAARKHGVVSSRRALVGITIWVDREGSVQWAELSESTGNEVLDEVALTLFRHVVAFRPAVESGERVARSMIFYVLFPW